MHAAPVIPEPSIATLAHGEGDAWWGALALAACGIALAMLMRATHSRRTGPGRTSAWAIAAGLCVAAALGPAVAGRVQPALYERFIGGLPPGSEAAAAVESAKSGLRARAAAESAVSAAQAAASATPSPSLSEALEQVSHAEGAATQARRAHAAPRHAAASWLAALLLALCLPRVRGVASPLGTLTVAAWSAVLPAVLGYALMRMWVGADAVPSLAVAAALAVGASFPTAPAWRVVRHADGTRGALCAHSGAWAWLAAGVAIAVAVLLAARAAQAGASAADVHAVPNAAWAAIAICCCVCIAAPAAARLLRPAGARPVASEAARSAMRGALHDMRWRGLAIDCVTAATVAIAAAGTDPIQWNWLWTALAFGLIAEDGRCLSAWAACVLQGTHTVRDAARVGAMSEESSRPMVALAAVGVAAGLLGPGLFAAIAAGALAVDVTWGMRRRIALAPAPAT